MMKNDEFSFEKIVEYEEIEKDTWFISTLLYIFTSVIAILSYYAQITELKKVLFWVALFFYVWIPICLIVDKISMRKVTWRKIQ